jgi:hypothetical protein
VKSFVEFYARLKRSYMNTGFAVFLWYQGVVVVRVVVWDVRSEPNIQGGVLGGECLMESTETKLKYCQRKCFCGRGGTFELLLGAVSNFAWEFSSMADLLQNDKRYRKFDWNMNCSIQSALHDYGSFAIVRL